MTLQRARVAFLDLRRAYSELREEMDAAVQRVLDSGRYLLGPETEAFESEWAEACGARHAVTVGSGLDALELALAAMNIGPGDEVIVPGHTFVATWLAVTHLGAQPVPVDVSETTFCMDPGAAEAAVTARTRAVIPVDLYGHPSDATAIRRMCDRFGLAFVEDAAQAHGARRHGLPVGRQADVTVWSFYPGKNLGALGDGGAITTDDAAVAATIRRRRNYGSERKYVHVSDGRNSRLDEMQCALLRVKLTRLPAWNARRRAIAERYRSALAGTELQLPRVEPGVDHAWHIFAGRVHDRDRLLAALDAAGVECLVHYPVPPHRQPVYESLRPPMPLDVTEQVCAEEISLPIGPHLVDEEVDTVIDAVRDALA